MKIGQKIQLGAHLLIFGDATESIYYENLPQVDLLLTDPPYNVSYKGQKNNKRKVILNDNLGKHFEDFVSKFLLNSSKLLKEGCSYYIFTAGIEVGTYQKVLDQLDFYQSSQLIWVKNHFVLSFADYKARHEHVMYGWKKGKAHRFFGERNASTILSYPKPTKNRHHPTMKPSELINKLIVNSSKVGDVILDPFAGSGTTLLEAQKLGRKCITFELDEEYIHTIINRFKFHYPDETTHYL